MAELVIANFFWKGGANTMSLQNAQIGREYTVRDIITHDEELDSFLFSLGCYSGEPITVVSRRWGSCIVAIKDVLVDVIYGVTHLKVVF